MLPNFARLRLDDRKNRSAPTGEFWALSQTKADELNEGGRGDPIGFDTYRPFQAVASPHATFRVRNRDPQGDGTYNYTYYNATTLWQWAKDNAKLPLTGEPIWKEDWWLFWVRPDFGKQVPSFYGDGPYWKCLCLSWGYLFRVCERFGGDWYSGGTYRL